MKRKPLTLQTALYHCARMWAGMAKTGQSCKPILGIRGNCWLCEYFSIGRREENKQPNGGCEECSKIMNNIWRLVCDIDSPYANWLRSITTEERKKYARQIADEAWRQWRIERAKNTWTYIGDGLYKTEISGKRLKKANFT